MSRTAPVTQLLKAWSAGEQSALAQITPMVYDELRQIAARYVRRERVDHTLQATALINEAYVALVDANVEWNGRTHFFAIASNVMRRILIDHARAAARDKRGGGAIHVTLSEAAVADTGDTPPLLEIDEALDRLGEIDERKAQIVEMFYFGGMNYEEIGTALNISSATVTRELRFARAWMRRELSDEADPPPTGAD